MTRNIKAEGQPLLGSISSRCYKTAADIQLVVYRSEHRPSRKTSLCEKVELYSHRPDPEGYVRLTEGDLELREISLNVAS